MPMPKSQLEGQRQPLSERKLEASDQWSIAMQRDNMKRLAKKNEVFYSVIGCDLRQIRRNHGAMKTGGLIVGICNSLSFKLPVQMQTFGVI